MVAAAEEGLEESEVGLASSCSCFFFDHSMKYPSEKNGKIWLSLKAKRRDFEKQEEKDESFCIEIVSWVESNTQRPH